MDSIKSGANIKIETFGCKVNTYDTGLLESKFNESGLNVTQEISENGDSPQVFLLNSCAVTAEATAQVLRQARKIKRDHPQSKVVVTGCSAQVDSERILGQSGVDLIVANSHKSELPQLVQRMLDGEYLDPIYKSNIFKLDDLGVGGGDESGHTRSFLKIQDGCDSFCTFCVIPFARGKSRSISVEDLTQKVNQLHHSGFLEVVLTGVHIGDYRDDQGRTFEDLVESVLVGTQIPRIRISSLEPIELTPRLLEFFKEDRLCAHFHMSIQSGTTSVLNRMKRNYGAEHVANSFEAIAKHVPKAFVGMDIIAGFPEETEKEFLKTYQLLEQTPWTRMHVFPYSARPLTYAARSYQALPHEVVKARAARLRVLSAERHAQKALEQIGTKKKVLWLKSDTHLKGISRDYWTVLVDLPVGHNVDLIKLRSQESEIEVSGCEREESRTGELRLYSRGLKSDF